MFFSTAQKASNRVQNVVSTEQYIWILYVPVLSIIQVKNHVLFSNLFSWLNTLRHQTSCISAQRTHRQRQAHIHSHTHWHTHTNTHSCSLSHTNTFIVHTWTLYKNIFLLKWFKTNNEYIMFIHYEFISFNNTFPEIFDNIMMYLKFNY